MTKNVVLWRYFSKSFGFLQIILNLANYYLNSFSFCLFCLLNIQDHVLRWFFRCLMILIFSFFCHTEESKSFLPPLPNSPRPMQPSHVISNRKKFTVGLTHPKQLTREFLVIYTGYYHAILKRNMRFSNKSYCYITNMSTCLYCWNVQASNHVHMFTNWYINWYDP